MWYFPYNSDCCRNKIYFPVSNLKHKHVHKTALLVTGLITKLMCKIRYLKSTHRTVRILLCYLDHEQGEMGNFLVGSGPLRTSNSWPVTLFQRKSSGMIQPNLTSKQIPTRVVSVVRTGRMKNTSHKYHGHINYFLEQLWNTGMVWNVRIYVFLRLIIL